MAKKINTGRRPIYKTKAAWLVVVLVAAAGVGTLLFSRAATYENVITTTSETYHTIAKYEAAPNPANYLPSAAERVRLAAFYNDALADHYYTTATDYKTVTALKNIYGYSETPSSGVGTVGYIPNHPVNGTVPLHRLWNPTSKVHSLAANDQVLSDKLKQGYSDEGIIGYIYTGQPTSIAGSNMAQLVQVYSPTKSDYYYSAKDADWQHKRDYEGYTQDQLVIGWVLTAYTGGLGDVAAPGTNVADCKTRQATCHENGALVDQKMCVELASNNYSQCGIPVKAWKSDPAANNVNYAWRGAFQSIPLHRTKKDYNGQYKRNGFNDLRACFDMSTQVAGSEKNSTFLIEVADANNGEIYSSQNGYVAAGDYYGYPTGVAGRHICVNFSPKSTGFRVVDGQEDMPAVEVRLLVHSGVAYIQSLSIQELLDQ